MSERIELKWGETPWDNWTPEQLRREVQRMYAALGALGSVARMHRQSNPDSPFWGPDGTGGRAIEMERQISAGYDGYDSESVYRAFFRYAYDLLFEQTPGARIGFGWAVCPACAQMVGNMYLGNGVHESNVGKPCISHGMGRPGCTGTLRALTWDDLQPAADAQADHA